MKKTKLSKSIKAQITIFMIIGIVLLFSSALFFHMKNTITSYKPISKPTIESVPLEIQPFQRYITNCLETTAYEAITKISLGGGYINPEEELVYFPNLPDRTELINFGLKKVPLWSYYYDPGAYVDNKRPDLYQNQKGDDSMESQIETYVESNLKSCTAGFNLFRNRYNITEGDVTAEVRINEKSVTVNIDYPIELRFKGTGVVEEVSKFGILMPTKLKRMYDLATEIVNKQRDDHFIENVVLDMLEDYSGLDRPIPPSYEAKVFGRIGEIWVTPEVKQEIKKDILPYVNLIQIANTKNYIGQVYNIGDPTGFMSNVYSGLLYQGITKNFDDLTVKLKYPNSDFNLDINGGQYLVVSKNSFGIDTSSFIGAVIGAAFDEFEAFYTLSFPVVISIYDEEAFNGKGQYFYFALEANILNNNPRSAGEEMTDQRVPTGYKPSINSEQNLVKRTIVVETIDAYTKKPIEDVTIIYHCGNGYEQGKTKLENGRALLKKKFPFCQLGGNVLGKKFGYLTKAVPYNNVDGLNPVTIKLEMYKMVELNYEIQQRGDINIEAIKNNPSAHTKKFEMTDIDEYESFVVITLTRKKESIFEEEVPLIGTVLYGTLPTGEIEIGETSGGISDDIMDDLEELAKEEGFDASSFRELANIATQTSNDISSSGASETELASTTEKLSVVPGIYSVEGIYLAVGNSIVDIEQEEIEYCDGVPLGTGLCLGDEETVILPSLKLPMWSLGGVRISEFEITDEMIYNNQNKINFYVYGSFAPYDYDSLKELPDNEALVEEYSSAGYLTPVIG